VGDRDKIPILCASALERAALELARCAGGIRHSGALYPICNESAVDAVSELSGVVLLIADPRRGGPDAWWTFHAGVLRVSQGLRSCIICETHLARNPIAVVKRVRAFAGIEGDNDEKTFPVESLAGFSGGLDGSVDVASAVLYEYLLTATEAGSEPDGLFIQWLLTCGEFAPAVRSVLIRNGLIEGARIAAVLASSRTVLSPEIQSGPARLAHGEPADQEAELERLRTQLQTVEQQRQDLQHILFAAESELRIARQFAVAFSRHLHKKENQRERGVKFWRRAMKPPKNTPGEFDEQLYLALYPDVAAAIQAGKFRSGQQHWMRCGKAEGRFSALVPEQFDVPQYFREDEYLARNPDVREALARGQFTSGFDHWVLNGMREARSVFELPYPKQANSRVAAATSTGLEFDEDLYLFFNPDVARAVRKGSFDSGLEHWQKHGSFEGRAGGALDLVEDRRQFLPLLAKRSPGVNVYGFLSTTSGLGSHIRGAVKALEARSIPFTTVDIPPWDSKEVERRNVTAATPHRINLIQQNADMMGRFLRAYGKDLLQGCYNIGYWAWELPSCRMDWWGAYRYVDEVWVASEFVRHSLQTMTTLPVTRIPLVVDALDEKAVYGRDHFGFPGDVFVFGYVFDISSQLERKNPECLIEAFRRAFGYSKDVLLFLKSSNTSHDSAAAARLARLADAPNIRMYDEIMAEEEIASLHKCLDCFVSPHRSEGFGLNLAEAMYFGKPVIATGYSSNIDFMREENSYLIDYRLRPISKSMGPYLKGFVWADPSVEHLEMLLRRVYENVSEREEKGRKAAAEIRNHYSAVAVGRMMEERFRTLGLDSGQIPKDLIRPHSSSRTWPQLSPPGAPEVARQQIRAFDYQPLISIVTPVYNVDPEYLCHCIESVRAQWYPHWELCLCDDASTREDTREALWKYAGSDPRIKVVGVERNLGIAGASNRGAEISSGEFIALLDNDDTLTPDALYETVKALNADEGIDLLYSDEDKIGLDGRYCDDYYKPDWSPEHLMSVMYVLHMVVFRKDLFYEIGAFRPEYSGAQDYDLVLRLSRTARKIVHIPKILYHWRKSAGSAAAEVNAKPAALEAAERALAEHVRASGRDAEVIPGKYTGSFRVRYRIAGQPRVTLVITTNDGSANVPRRGRINLVSHFVQSIAQKTDYRNYEILLVDNGNLSQKTRRALSGIPYRLVSYTGPQSPFNFAKKANYAFGKVSTEHLVLLNDDLEVITAEWLSALLEFSQQREVGVVGARLIFPNETIQHVGVVIGVNGSTAHAYYGYPRDFIGYNGYTHLIRNYSAVTGACIATRREVLTMAGGFNERFAIDYNDTDFCLTVREHGYRIVYTPYCELYHFEGVTTQRKVPRPMERQLFVERWPEYMDRDPFYNPNLSRHGVDLSAQVPPAPVAQMAAGDYSRLLRG